jgi:hypothetical protein
MKTSKISFNGSLITKKEENLENNPELKKYFARNGQAANYLKKNTVWGLVADVYTNQKGRTCCRFLEGEDGDKLFQFFIKPETEPKLAIKQFETIATLVNAFYKQIKGPDMADVVSNCISNSIEALKKI